MSNILLRRQAVEMRKLGKSYNQIRDELKVSKSTLAYWLKEYPLTRIQKEALKENIGARIEKYRQTMRLKREKKLSTYFNEAKKELLPLSKRDLLIAGIFLYWGEGSKSMNGQLVIANTDPSLVQFAMIWMTKALEIPKEKINILVHIYNDMNIEESLNFWSNLLKISRSQFSKPYIKDSLRSKIDYKGYGHGTCNLRVFNTEIKEKVMMSIKTVANYAKDSMAKI